MIKFDDVQLNDAELEQVVGGQDVLSLQAMSADGDAAAGCISWCSCASSVSSKSGRSDELAESIS
jgi:hypothetical protein